MWKSIAKGTPSHAQDITLNINERKKMTILTKYELGEKLYIMCKEGKIKEVEVTEINIVTALDDSGKPVSNVEYIFDGDADCRSYAYESSELLFRDKKELIARWLSDNNIKLR